MIKEIIELREMIPSFKCKTNCHACCGIVPWTKVERDEIADKRKATSITCPYVSPEGCECYENRPILCRLFGTVEKMKCSYGYGPLLMLSSGMEKAIMNKYQSIELWEGKNEKSFLHGVE